MPLVVHQANRTALVSPLRTALKNDRPLRPMLAARCTRKLTLTALVEIRAGLVQDTASCGPARRTSSKGNARVHPHKVVRQPVQPPGMAIEALKVESQHRRVSFAAQLERVHLFNASAPITKPLLKA